MYTRAPEGELAGELGVWRRTVIDPCGPGRTSVPTAPIDGQGPTPSWVWSRRPCAIGTSAPRVGPDGSHASSSGPSVPRPTVSGTCAASYTGIFAPSGRAGNRSSGRRTRLQGHGSAFKGVDDLLSSGDLAEVGKDLGEGVRVGRGVDVGDGIFGEDQVVAVFPGAARGGFHPDAGGDACQNDLGHAAAAELEVQLGSGERPPVLLDQDDVAGVRGEVVGEFGVRRRRGGFRAGDEGAAGRKIAAVG